jgi:hypothetical protein
MTAASVAYTVVPTIFGMMRAAFVTALLLLSAPVLSIAQTMNERGFVGGGIGSGTDDAPNRNRVAYVGEGTPNHHRVWLLEASAFRTGRVAYGVEFVDLGDVYSALNSACCLSSDTQHESALLGMVRTRVARAGRLNADLIGGGGTLFQRQVKTGGVRLPAINTTTTTTAARSPAFALGADLPVDVLPHLVIAPLIRLYFLRRDEIPEVPGSTVLDQQPSRRFSVGVTGRATW